MTDLPGKRELLTGLARKELAGELRLGEEDLAERLRILAPDLEYEDDEHVIGRFEELVSDVASVDGLADGGLTWHDVLPEAKGDDRDAQAETAANAKLDDTLDALLGLK